jgi:MOSC domain-containing protein YiiM
VVQEGEISAGDAIELIHQDEHNVTVSDIVKIYVREAIEDLVRRAIQVQALAIRLRNYSQQQLERCIGVHRFTIVRFSSRLP